MPVLTLDEIGLRAVVKAQMVYYLSPTNLFKDSFLRCKMDNEGFIDIAVLADFKRLKSMTRDQHLILDVIRGSPESFELNHGSTKVRPRENPMFWPQMNQRLGIGHPPRNHAHYYPANGAHAGGWLGGGAQKSNGQHNYLSCDDVHGYGNGHYGAAAPTSVRYGGYGGGPAHYYHLPPSSAQNGRRIPAVPPAGAEPVVASTSAGSVSAVVTTAGSPSLKPVFFKMKQFVLNPDVPEFVPKAISVCGDGHGLKLSGDADPKLSGDGQDPKLSGDGQDPKLSGDGHDAKLSGKDRGVEGPRSPRPPDSRPIIASLASHVGSGDNNDARDDSNELANEATIDGSVAEYSKPKLDLAPSESVAPAQQ